MRGVSLQELSSATRISTRFLTAIENGHWEELPGGAFNRGFIRSASRYLGLDEDGMVAEYSLEVKGNGAWHAEVRPARSERHWKRLGISAVLAVVLLAGLWFAASRTISRFRAHPSTMAPSQQMQRKGTAAVAAPATAPLQLTVRGVLAAKIRVVADGKIVAQEVIQPNQEQRFSAKDGFRVSASDSRAVELELNGQPVRQMGRSGLPGTITLTARDVKSSAGGNH
jgi:cytoskeletal protein RodZ